MALIIYDTLLDEGAISRRKPHSSDPVTGPNHSFLTIFPKKGVGMETRKSCDVTVLEWSPMDSSNEQRDAEGLPLPLVARDSHLNGRFPSCHESIGLDRHWVFSLTKIL